MKVLVLDIENSFLIGGMWGMWNQTISLDGLLDHGHMMCWGAKWLGDKVITWRRYNDPLFLTELHDMLNECDAVVTYNGRRHDLPMINREFIKANMAPPSPYKHIDLLDTAKRHFKFPSNKMQNLLTELNLGSKIKHEGIDLWTKCLLEDKQAWGKMQRYNINDVRKTEKLYIKLRPWISNHPNHSLFTQSTVCPNCGSKHLNKRGTATTRTGVFQKFVCKKCGHWARTRYTEVAKEARAKIVVSA